MLLGGEQEELKKKCATLIAFEDTAAMGSSMKAGKKPTECQNSLVSHYWHPKNAD